MKKGIDQLLPDRDYRIPSACGLIGLMNQSGKAVSGEWIIRGIACLHERSNGLGGGFAGYGIYPEHPDDYAFHIMYDNLESKKETEKRLWENYEMMREEPLPTHPIDAIKPPPLWWRYFMKPKMENRIGSDETEEDFVVRTVMEINQGRWGAFIASSGKNMGIFKGVGYAEEPVGTYVGTGMHAGKIYVRGHVNDYQLGKEIRVFDLDKKDWEEMQPFLQEYCRDFKLSLNEIRRSPFVKLVPHTHRPYGKLYAY